MHRAGGIEVSLLSLEMTREGEGSFIVLERVGGRASRLLVRATYESSPLGKVTILELPKGNPSLRAISWAS